MEHLRSLTLAAAAAAALAAGCIHVHTDADGKVKSVELKAAAGPEPAAPPADPNVKQAAATVPAPAVSGAAAGLAKLAPKLPALGAGPQAVEMALTWQNKLAQLPDPTAGGAFKPGLVGQMFLFGPGPKMPFAQADGKLTVELFDATPRPGATEPVRLGGWTFEKEWLRRLVTTDERFGRCYALFLPWPTYTPTVTRVRLTARYEPENGFALYAEPTTITIDTSVGGDGSPAVRTAAPAPGPVLMPATPQLPGPAPAALPTTTSPAGPPIPIHPPAAGGPPPGLPPLSITVPGH